jgi:hypothetical protein
VAEAIVENTLAEVLISLELCLKIIFLQLGPNTNNNFLSGGVTDLIGNLIGEAAHRFLGKENSNFCSH